MHAFVIRFVMISIPYHPQIHSVDILFSRKGKLWKQKRHLANTPHIHKTHVCLQRHHITNRHWFLVPAWCSTLARNNTATAKRWAENSLHVLCDYCHQKTVPHCQYSCMLTHKTRARESNGNNRQRITWCYCTRGRKCEYKSKRHSTVDITAHMWQTQWTAINATFLSYAYEQHREHAEELKQVACANEEDRGQCDNLCAPMTKLCKLSSANHAWEINAKFKFIWNTKTKQAKLDK